MEKRQRTLAQNRALHLLFEMLSQELNDAGLEMRKVLKPEVEIPWSKDSVKEYLWRPIQKIQLGKTSTKDLNTKDIDKVFETLIRHLSSKFGISTDFPSIMSVMMKQNENNNS